MYEDTAALRTIIERPHTDTLWGIEKTLTPRLVDAVLGDGQQLIYFTPIMTRPNFFVVRIGSDYTLSNWEYGEVETDEWVERVWDEIADQFTEPDSDGYSWPAVDPSDGCSWGALDLSDWEDDVVKEARHE